MNKYKWPLMKDTISFTERLKIAKFALTTSKFTKGDQCLAFEEEWNQWLGSRHSLFVSSGSTANLLLVAAVMEKYDLRPGDKVLLPACTWVTNVSPIMQLGLTPVFCDVNLEDFSFDKESVYKVAENHKDIKAVFITHLLGFPADKSFISSVFPESIIIDDVCESHGAVDINGIKVGADSIGATFSFYFGHHMTTIEGGMVSTNDTELYDIMLMKRSHGMARESQFFDQYAAKNKNLSPQFLFITDGYNFRNHEIPALIGRSQLKKLDKSIEIRKNNYELFRKIINSHPDSFYPVQENLGNSSFCFPIISKSIEIKNNLENMLYHNGIEYRPIVGGNLLKQPFLKNNTLTSASLRPKADIINEFGLYVGNSQYVSEKDLLVLEGVLDEC
jgi:CDP-4-dehydro-6-deoxyglucose reductase, E1